MRKTILATAGAVTFLLIFGLITPTVIIAANVTLQATTNAYLSDLSLTLTVTGDTDQMQVNTSNIVLTTCAGCTVTIESTDRRVMATDLPNTSVICDSSKSYVSIYTEASQTVTVTPDASATCAASSGGGGGSSVNQPSNASVTINNNEASTTSRNVTLALAVINADSMMVSNNTNFSDVTAWETYAASKSWQLTDGSGEKTVYAKFRNNSGSESSKVSDTITYNAPTTSTPSEEPATEEPQTPASPGTDQLEGKLVNTKGSGIYLVENGVLRPIPNESVFLANGYKWSDIKTTDLSKYQIGDFLGYPENYEFTDGMLVKATNANVYVISNNKIRWIISEEIFNALKYKWSRIYNISDSRLATYMQGEPVNLSDIHPDGTLIKYASSPKVYVVKNGEKRWILTEEAFKQNSYRWDDIIEIASTEQYEDGENIGGLVLGVETTNIFVSYLSLGSSDEEVRLLQDKLKQLGFFPQAQASTGFYGLMTQKAVMDFQTAKGLEPLGVVGPSTRDLLNSL